MQIRETNYIADPLSPIGVSVNAETMDAFQSGEAVIYMAKADWPIVVQSRDSGSNRANTRNEA